MDANRQLPPNPRTESSSAESNETSADLVARVQAGDAASMNALYLRYRDRLLLSIRCRLGPHLRSRLESEDILQSVFKDVIDDIGRFEQRGPWSLNRYLHTCVLNKIRKKAEHYGAAKRTGETPLTDSLMDRLPDRMLDGGIVDGGFVDGAYLDAERFEALEGALARLPEEMREVVILRRVEELTNHETARVIGKTPDATSKLYNRALAKLAVWMGAGTS